MKVQTKKEEMLRDKSRIREIKVRVRDGLSIIKTRQKQIMAKEEEHQWDEK